MVVRDEEHVTGRDLVQPRVAVRVSVRLVRDLPVAPSVQQVARPWVPSVPPSRWPT